jgi:MarR family transcriptional regulator, organic hydroperoxide resistance regulator
MHIHISMAAHIAKPDNHPIEASKYPCVCAAIRKAGRVLTRKYDHYLKPSGIKITQFSMLANIARNPDITVSGLSKLLLMQQTTVTRNLQVLEKAGYIHLEPEATDCRIKKIRLTDMGMSRMDEARPFWEKAQLEMAQTLGKERLEALLDSLGKTAE